MKMAQRLLLRWIKELVEHVHALDREEMTMPDTASEIMDPDFCHASQTDSIGHLLQEMSELGLGSIPVLDLSGHPLGMATVSEIDRCRHLEELTEHLQHPAVSVHQNTPIPAAARALAAQNADRLILVDDAGVAVGALSAVDLLRALLGLGVNRAGASEPAPASSRWSSSQMFYLDALAHVPTAPGVILMSSVGDAAHTKFVWAESTLNLRERLDDMLRRPQSDPVLEDLLYAYPRMLSFRVLVVSDLSRRERVVRALQALMKRSNASAEPARQAAG
jgi:CBS domain-containing protein